jgi:HlyD family secretion protein
MNKSILVLLVLVCVVGGGYLLLGGDTGGATAQPPVTVQRDTIVKTAVATGRIEPEHEVTVRSQFSGLIGERFVKLGDTVQPGHPLVDVRQETTRLSIISARRAIESARLSEEAAEEFLRGEHLQSSLLRLMQGEKEIERMLARARLGRRQAEEQLEFLENGQLRIGDEVVDTIVRAPVGGCVIHLASTPGQRVVPVGSYQEPTKVAIIADMDHLEFRGSVDEIDVGKLHVGMRAEVRVGALPGVTLEGTVQEVGLKARVEDQATLFDVWLEIAGRHGQTIRAGYSATARIFIEQRENVLVLPERVVEFRDDEALVRVSGPGDTPVERKIEVGLSDGLLIEVVDGLAEGDLVLEREYEQIR